MPVMMEVRCQDYFYVQRRSFFIPKTLGYIMTRQHTHIKKKTWKVAIKAAPRGSRGGVGRRPSEGHRAQLVTRGGNSSAVLWCMSCIGK